MTRERANVDRIAQAKSVVFLTASLVMAVTWAIGSTGWTKGLSIIAFVGMGSILIGFMLARSLLPGFLAHLFSMIIGLSWSFWVTSRLLPTTYTWAERWQNLMLRLNQWYDQAIQGGTSYDNLMFVLQMSVIIWGMGYLTIWFIFRSGHVWQAIVPGGLVLIINLYYAPNDITLWFLIYLLISLLLVIRFNVFRQEIQWRDEGVFFRPDISFDFLRDGFIFSTLVIMIAWLMPPIVDAQSLGLLDRFTGSWRDIQGEWNRLYADLNYRESGVTGTFGQSLSLGGPRHLTEDPVMDVQINGIGRYWRAAVYDLYTGTGWRSTDQDSASIGPEEELTLPTFAAQALITQTYTLYRDGTTTLYAMSNPVHLDRSGKATFNALSVEQISPMTYPLWPEGSPLVEEITYLRSDTPINQGESYQVVSKINQAAINQLIESSTNYPDWITKRYLQLPKTVTRRTHQLAQELAAPYDNPFHKAQAIERYLRMELTYNEQMAAPPSGLDKVDYVLFESKEAYCDYYASAMIVMLRSAGIPARLAAGFARGIYDSEKDAFHVRNADAHSWVEVYFSEYGWIEFEPTAAQPNIIRPTSEDGSLASNLPLEEETETSPEESTLEEERSNIPIDEEAMIGDDSSFFAITVPWSDTQLSLSSVGRGGFFILIAILVGFVLVKIWWHRSQKQITQSIVDLYAGMIRLARWMGINPRPWQTPYEYASILRRYLPDHAQEVETITDEYVRHTFSSGNLEKGTTLTYESNLAWRRLSPEMIKTIFKRRLPNWLKR